VLTLIVKRKERYICSDNSHCENYGEVYMQC
jgi:hypothetical protein